MLIVWSFYFCLRQCTSSESKFVWRLITDKDQDILGKKKARKGQSARAVLDSQWLNLFYITPVVFFISCNQRTAEKLSDWKCQSVVWSRTILKIYTVPSNIFAIYCIIYSRSTQIKYLICLLVFYSHWIACFIVCMI